MIKICNPLNSFLDYPDNCSHSLVLYTTECEHNCKNCHSIDRIKLDNFTSSVDDLSTFIKDELKKINSNKLCIEGGDPLHPFTIDKIKQLISKLDNVDICIYTGYDIDYVKKNNVSGFKFIKTGKYNELLKQNSEKTNNYIQFASINQKLYDSNFKCISKNGRYYF